jgi:SprT-like family
LHQQTTGELTMKNALLYPERFTLFNPAEVLQPKARNAASVPSGTRPAKGDDMPALDSVATHGNRETWLRAAVVELAPMFAQRAGDKDARARVMPPVKVSCGFPSAGGKGKRKQTIGECWKRSRSADKANQIFISPTLSDPVRVLGVLVHELCHAVDDSENAHKAPFGTLARAMALEGKLTATTEGDEFRREIAEPIIAKLGAYPHSGLDVSKLTKPTQATRMLKAECPCCGYAVRLSRKWLDVATPTCPDTDCEKFGVEMAVDMGAFGEE